MYAVLEPADRPDLHHVDLGRRPLPRRCRHAHPSLLQRRAARHRQSQSHLCPLYVALRVPRRGPRARRAVGCLGWRADRERSARRQQASPWTSTQARPPGARRRRGPPRRPSWRSAAATSSTAAASSTASPASCSASRSPERPLDLPVRGNAQATLGLIPPPPASSRSNPPRTDRCRWWRVRRRVVRRCARGRMVP